jgi:adenylylsulfate kinase-like enzyme
MSAQECGSASIQIWLVTGTPGAGKSTIANLLAAAILAMLRIPGLCGADIDLSAGMIAPA